MARQGTHTTAKARARFLAELAGHANVTRAAEAAGFDRQTAYVLRAKLPEFAGAWDDALEQAADVLEREAQRRAVAGVPEPLVSMGKLVRGEDGTPLTVQRYSDSLLMFLLKGARPGKYRDNLHVTAQQQQLGITVVLESMRSDRSIAEAAADFVGLVDGLGALEG
jgi:hypothetical protein